MSLLPPIPTNFRAATALPPLIRLDRRTDVLLRAHAPSDAASPQPARRSKIWELAETLHCSIIGTCLSNAELRHALARLGVNGIEAADDHELHVVGVMLAGRRDAGAKMLQRALDRRHALAIKQYAKAKDEQALRQLWDESMRSSDIPGAYWALLSHAAATETIVKKAFQDVHMLSHLVGAANRADIRRLRELEAEKGALTEKLHRQQQQLRDGFTSRDETIRQLNALLARHAPAEGSSANRESGQEDAASAGEETSRNVIADLNRKLGQETTRRERLEQRLSAMSATMKKTAAALQTVARRAGRSAPRDRVARGSHRRGAAARAGDGEPALELSARTILYVGGRAQPNPAIESAGRAHRGALPPPRRRHRAQLVAAPRAHQPGRRPAVPDRLHQPRRGRHAQAAVPAAGEAVPAVADGEPRDARVVIGGDGDQQGCGITHGSAGGAIGEMTQQGMISDADGDIAALVYAAGDRPDQVLLDFARHVSDSGRTDMRADPVPRSPVR